MGLGIVVCVQFNFSVGPMCGSLCVIDGSRARERKYLKRHIISYSPRPLKGLLVGNNLHLNQMEVVAETLIGTAFEKKVAVQMLIISEEISFIRAYSDTPQVTI